LYWKKLTTLSETNEKDALRTNKKTVRCRGRSCSKQKHSFK